MKKSVKRGMLIFTGLLLLGGVAYLVLALYYQNTFAINTWINGVYCTGESVETINSRLTEKETDAESLVVHGLEEVDGKVQQREWSVSMQELHRTIDYSVNLKACKEEQNSWLWLTDRHIKQYGVSPQIFVDETILKEWWDAIVESVYKEEDYRIEYGEDVGYLLFDGLHNRLDGEKAYNTIKEAVYQGEARVDLVEADCFYDVPFNAEQSNMQELWEKIDAFTGAGPFCDYGDGAVQIDRITMAAFLKKQEMPRLPLQETDGSLTIDREAVRLWVQEQAEQHDTYQKTWNFESTKGETVTVEGGTYGSSIDQSAETEWLTAYLQKLAEGKAVETTTLENPHVPVYTREAFHKSSADLGDTYIEVDMGNQQLYYYKDGELLLETAVVTGNMKRKMSAPEGVNCVQNKQKNRVLRGPGYATPVKFWMPVKGNIGIHDANWRTEFGEDIYLSNGSHGCINVPLEMMEKLYDMVEVGTPVVMFYDTEEESQA